MNGDYDQTDCDYICSIALFLKFIECLLSNHPQFEMYAFKQKP